MNILAEPRSKVGRVVPNAPRSSNIATSLSIEPDDFGLSPFAQRGGLGKAHQLFGDALNPILDELNLALVA